MVCPGIGEHVSDGDELEVDMEEGTVRNLTTGETLTGQRVTGYALEILKSGGIKPLMRKKMQAARQ
jgi:3-isopropylmalate/(R)-2-methylmalate dehydratase small subunit